jgi:hypothetical protein
VAKELSMVVDTMLDQPLEVARKDMVCLLICDHILSSKPFVFASNCKAVGEQLPSFVSESLPELEGLPRGKEYADLESVIKDTAAVMYLGETLRFPPSVLLFDSKILGRRD